MTAVWTDEQWVSHGGTVYTGLTMYCYAAVNAILDKDHARIVFCHIFNCCIGHASLHV